MKSWLTYFVLFFCLHLIEGFHSFRCDYKYSSTAKGWLKYIDVPANWYDARLRCALEGAVLASPTTVKIKAEMTRMINSTRNGNEEEIYEVFTGIHAFFSPGAYLTVDGIPFSKIPHSWAVNEPDNKDDKEQCLTMNSFGDLSDVPCDDNRAFICYRPVKWHAKTRVNECGTVDPEYHLDARTNSCYKFHTVPRNYSRAFLTCYAEGGHLAIINSEVEANVLKELFAKYPREKMHGNFWKDIAFIGIHNWGELWDFRTIHGQTLKEAGYDKFAGGEPNNVGPGESCGAIYRSGLLDDLWCNPPAAFICEKDPDYPDVCQAVTDQD